MEYNTQKEKLILPEYGRCIQQMVDYAKTISDRKERLRCACTIVSLMANIQEQHGNPEDFKQKMWNHLAAMSNYELDIDYPVEIEQHTPEDKPCEHIPYPQKNIQKRHYGSIIESLAKKLCEIEDEEERDALASFVANQMKRSLANWNRDAMDEEKVIDDLAQYTNGKIQLDPYTFKFISDSELINASAQNTKKKKRK